MISMVAGMRIAGRFVLEQPASSGAMGTIFRACDMQTGQRVALKLLHSAGSSPQSATRLEIEAEVLSRLRHPHIVSYVAHGRTQSGLPFLAMEWLDGEDLDHRLRRSLLSVPECYKLLLGIGSALADAHRCGITHRDIKPSNLFLPQGRIEQVKLLDFGVAREEDGLLALTRTGSLVGTLEYMAPEQVRGAHAVGPAADIFSLGCVVYECLSGRPPLQSASITELFIKSASHEIPPITKLRSGVPPAFAQLLHRMLDKNPARRPTDGAALLHELEALGEGRSGEPAASLAVPREPFAQIDQQLLSVILLCTLELKPHTPSTLDEDGSPPEAPLLSEVLHETLQRWGAFSERLSDDLCLITLTERGTAADLAMQTCRLALQVSRLRPEATTILATGLGVIYEGRVSGPVVERLLEFMHAQRASEFPSTAARGKVWLNTLTAGLVDPEFVVRRVATGLFELTGARDYTTAVRPVADKLTPCVGRERELAALATLLRESIEESLARAVLLVAPYGRGKSRLRHELLSRVAAAHPGLTLLIGRGDPLSVGAGGSLLAECLRQLSRITPDDPPAQAEAKLQAALQRFLPDEQQQRCLPPLTQLVVQPLGLEPLARHSLAAAGSLRDSLEQAFVQFLFTASAAGPILLVLEDLHHADAMSVRVVQRALRELDERPFMVLALARPEVHSIFPRLWVEQRMQELRLEPLLPAAINQLIQYVMTPEQAKAAAPYVLEHSCGNALFVEELILRALRDDSSW